MQGLLVGMALGAAVKAGIWSLTLEGITYVWGIAAFITVWKAWRKSSLISPAADMILTGASLVLGIPNSLLAPAGVP